MMIFSCKSCLTSIPKNKKDETVKVVFSPFSSYSYRKIMHFCSPFCWQKYIVDYAKLLKKNDDD